MTSTLKTVNPATEETIDTYKTMSDEEMRAAIELCHGAFDKWKLVSLEERAKVIKAIGQALRIAEHFGLPPALLEHIQWFYDHRAHWFTCAGAVHPDPVRPTCGLLRGCPFSVLLVIMLMTVWCKHVKHHAPEARLSCFLHDRNIWSELQDTALAARAVQEAVAATRRGGHPARLLVRRRHRASARRAGSPGWHDQIMRRQRLPPLRRLRRRPAVGVGRGRPRAVRG